MNNLNNAPLEFMQSVIAALLSWAFLAAVSIIISGKLISSRLSIGISDDASFEVPLLVFKIKAKGEEVITGFLSFILSLIACIFIGGPTAYIFFKSQAGVDIGHWNSLCLIASFLSLVVSTVICISMSFVGGSPVINRKDREETLRLLERKGDEERI